MSVSVCSLVGSASSPVLVRKKSLAIARKFKFLPTSLLITGLVTKELITFGCWKVNINDYDSNDFEFDFFFYHFTFFTFCNFPNAVSYIKLYL